ncbi:MAG TPA: TetR family transcriptional regulator, partial [Mycobacterium sp.]|nr:TetR family transcriptional regulator [Mycobacterium sp.]
EPLWTSITEAVLQPLDDEGATDAVPTPEQLGEVRKLVRRPEFSAAVSKGFFDDWVEAIAERTGTDPDRDLYPRLVAGIVRAVVEAAMDAYVTADPPVAVTVVLRRAFADVAAGLPEPRRRK